MVIWLRAFIICIALLVMTDVVTDVNSVVLENILHVSRQTQESPDLARLIGYWIITSVMSANP